MADLAKIVVSLVDKTKAGVESAKSGLRGLQGSLEGVRAAAGMVGTALALGGFATLTMDAIDAADALNDLAERTGIGAERLSEWAYAARLSGADIDTLRTGLKGFAKSLEEAQAPSSGMAQVFKAMGIATRDVHGALRPTEVLLAEVADRFSGYKDGAGKAALAMQVFGKAGEELIPFLNNGQQGLRELATEAHRLGVVMDAEFVAQSAAFNDQLDRLKMLSGAAGREIANQLLPALNEFAQQLVEAQKQGLTLFDLLNYGWRTDPFEDAHAQLQGLNSELQEAQQRMREIQAMKVGGWFGVHPENKKLLADGEQAEIDRLEKLIGYHKSVRRDWWVETDQDRRDGARRYRAPARAEKGESPIVGERAALRRAGKSEAERFAETLDKKQRSQGLDEFALLRVEAERIAGPLKNGADLLDRWHAAIDAMQGSTLRLKFETEGGERLEGLGDELAKLQGEVRNYGRSEAETAWARVRELEDRLARLPGRGNAMGDKAQLLAEIELQRQIAQAQDTLEQKRLNDPDNLSREWIEAAQRIGDSWADLGERLGRGMTSAFGQSAQSLATLVQGFGGYQKAMQGIEIRRREALKNEKDLGRHGQINGLAAREGLLAQAGMYGDLTASAKGFFKEGAAGYEVLGAAEKAFRIYEMMIAVDTAMGKIALTESVTAAKVLGDQAQTASALASVGPEVAAAQTKGMANAVAGVAGQAQGDPYTAWGRMAAMAAVMAGLGFAVGGLGGRGQTRDYAKERQDAAGKGSVFGDSGARSESIAKALELTAKASELSTSIESAMLRSLRAIEANMGGLAALTVKSGVASNGIGSTVQTGWETSTFGRKQAALDKAVTTDVMGGFGMLIGGPLGAIAGVAIGNALGGLVAGVTKKLFGTKTSVVDEGLLAGRQSVGEIASNGFSLSNYATIEKQKKTFGVKHGHKVSEQSQALGGELPQQFGLIIAQMVQATREGAQALGLGGDAFNAELARFSVDLGHISLKGLSGNQIEEQFSAIFGKVGDDMARVAIPALGEFAQIGEGAFQTLARLATELQTTDYLFARLGKTSQQAFGAVGMASLKAREHLIELSGGLDKFIEQEQTFYDAFYSEEEKKARLTVETSRVLREMGGAFATFDIHAASARTAWRDVVNAQDLSTEAGRKMRDQALKLTPALSDLMKPFEQASEGWKKLGGDLKGWLHELQLGDLSPLSVADRFQLAQTDYTSMLGKAKGGDLDAAGQLTGVAERLLGLAGEMYGKGGADYSALHGQTVSAINGVAAMALNGGVDPTTAAVRQSNDLLTRIWRSVEKLTSHSEAQITQQAAISQQASTDQADNRQQQDRQHRELMRERSGSRRAYLE